MREKSDFLKDVEIAVQGLERQKRENPQEEGEKVYRKFKESDKEAVRLAAALRGFFLREGVSETQREAFGNYIKEQILAASEELIEEEDVEKIAYLEGLGWFDREHLDAFIQIARARQKTAALVWLMHLKDKKYGYSEKSFPI
ncbi:MULTISPECIES: hypothetical protein [Blautia]|uniref:hypothetical protein n=1 Tax=Blautia TaxID=572511 RepID=UPI000BA3D5B9|nr:MULTISPECIES: hypothetical protein [Blautia]